MKKVYGQFMTTLILGGLCLMSLGCGRVDSVTSSPTSNNSTTTPTASSKINPPSWIQGTWVLSSTSEKVTFNFTTSDIIYSDSATTNSSFKARLASSSGNSNYTESATSTTYTFLSPVTPLEFSSIKCTSVSSNGMQLAHTSTSNSVDTVNFKKI